MQGPEPGQTKVVRFGQHELQVVSQRHARLRHHSKRLGFGSVEEFLLALALPVDGGHDRYELLCIAIPELAQKMPRFEWEGYASQEAMDADDYSEADDHSPSYDEIVAAGHAVVEVNGVGRLGKIVGLLTTIQSMGANSPNGNSTPSPLASPGATGE